MIDLIITNPSDIPIYRQIYNQISNLILNGKLPKDYGLPSIRTIAKELRISIITIKRAWEELERDGFIYTIAGKGCFVSADIIHNRQAIKLEAAKEKMSKDLEYYRGLGLSLDHIMAIMREVYHEDD
jgi:GntR family transcriptional regulator